MLTRLNVRGFKNLTDVDIRFGPFTCIAGTNGVGKSNLFEAIRFLSALADKTLMEAASCVRDEEGRATDVRGLFFRAAGQNPSPMFFEVEMIVPEEGLDDLGQKAKATITFLRYALQLGYRNGKNPGGGGNLELLKEELVHINIGDAAKHLLFPHRASKWAKAVVKGSRRNNAPFISTTGRDKDRKIRLHQDGRKGRPLDRLAETLPRTVLSATNAAENPTAFLARREMRLWQFLQLEPSALRAPDEFSAPARLGPNGSHLPATVYRLASHAHDAHPGQDSLQHQARVYQQMANRLAALIDDVHELKIDRDERRELLTLTVSGRDGIAYPARALSDGTLRFLALAVLAQDPEAQGLLCLEEPENGIHPERIPAMIELLKDIAVDPSEPPGPDNPLRQIIINTHSPEVVQQVPDDGLLVAEWHEAKWGEDVVRGVQFSCLPDTWRAKEKDKPAPICSKGKLLAYLNPVLRREPGEGPRDRKGRKQSKRVVDRDDIQPLLPGMGAGA